MSIRVSVGSAATRERKRRTYTRGFVALLVSSADENGTWNDEKADELFSLFPSYPDPNAILNGKTDSIVFNADAALRALISRGYPWFFAVWYVSAVTATPVVPQRMLSSDVQSIETFLDGSSTLQPVLGGKRGIHSRAEKLALVGLGYTSQAGARGMPFFVDGAHPDMFDIRIAPGFSVHAVEGTFNGIRFDNRDDKAFIDIIESRDQRKWALLRNDAHVLHAFAGSVRDGEDGVRHDVNRVTVWIQGSIRSGKRVLNPSETVQWLRMNLDVARLARIDDWAANTWPGWSPQRVLDNYKKGLSSGYTFWTKNKHESNSRYSRDYVKLMELFKLSEQVGPVPLVQFVYDDITSDDALFALKNALEEWIDGLPPAAAQDIHVRDRAYAQNVREHMNPMRQMAAAQYESAILGGVVFLPVQFSAASTSGLLGSAMYGGQMMPRVYMMDTIARLPTDMHTRISAAIKTWYAYCRNAIDKRPTADVRDRTRNTYCNLSPFVTTRIDTHDDYPFRYVRANGRYYLSTSTTEPTYCVDFTPAGERVRGFASVLVACYSAIGVASTPYARMVRAKMRSEAFAKAGTRGWWGSLCPPARNDFFVSGHVMAMLLMPMHEFTVAFDELLANYIDKKSSYAAPFDEPQKGRYHTRLEYIAGVRAMNHILQNTAKQRKRKVSYGMEGVTARSALITKVLTDPGWNSD